MAPRRTLLRWLAGIAAGLVVLGIAATAAIWLILKSLDFEAVVARVEQAVEQATGRTLTIGSRPQLTFRPLLKLVISDVTLANLPGGSRTEMLKLQQVEVGINLKPLARGQAPGLNLALMGPALLLEVTERGEANWVLKLSPEEALRHLHQAVTVLKGKVVLESVTVERAAIRYDNRRERRAMEIAVRQATLQIDADDRYELKLEGAIDKRPVTVDAGFRLPALGEPVTGKLSAALPGATLALEGTVLPAWPTSGTQLKVLAEIGDASGLAGILGLHVGKIPAIRINTQLHGTARGIRAEALRIDAGRSGLAGMIEADRFEPRLRVRGDIEAKVVDVPELLAARPAEPADRKPPVESGRIIPATPLPLSALHALDAELRLRVGRLLLPGSRSVESLQATLSLADGRLAIEPFSATVGSGSASGRLRLDARAPGSATLSTDVRVKGVELGSLVALAGLSSAGFRNGPTNAAIQLAANGGSARALMAALDGHVRVVVGEGRLPGKAADWSHGIIGPALDVINPYRKNEDGSPLKCAVVNVPVQRGVVVIKDTVAAETDKLVGSVTGSVDLGQERLDLTLHSQAVGGLTPGLASFASAAKLTGTLGKPQLAVNAEGAAAAGLRVGAAIASAGVTLLAGSVARKAMPAHPCRAALGADAEREVAQPEPTEAPAGKRGLFGRRKSK